MFRVVNEYISHVNLITDTELESRLRDFLGELTELRKYSLNSVYNRYVLDIRLKKFSVELSDKLYRDIERVAAYSYSHISVRYNEGDRVRYRFVTCRESRDGVCMDVIFDK